MLSLLDLQVQEQVPDFLSPLYFRRLRVYCEELGRLDSASRLFQTKVFPAGHLVLLVYKSVVADLVTNDDTLPAIQLEVRRAMTGSMVERLITPLVSKSSVLLKAALMHRPQVVLLKSWLSADVWESCVSSMKADITTLLGEGSLAGTIAAQVLDNYLDTAAALEPLPLPSVAEGKFGGVSALEQWQEVVKLPLNSRDPGALKSLIPLASMLLAAPAGESRDEFTFSVSGRIFTKDKNCMSPMHLEMYTVITMYLRNFGWSQKDAMAWVMQLLKDAHKKKLH